MSNCVNCNSTVNTNVQSYSLEKMDPELLSVFEQSINRESTDSDIACQYCFHTFGYQLQSREHKGGPPSTSSGQLNECVWCGRSLLRTRSHALPEGSEKKEIAARISPRQIAHQSRVCFACWMKAGRNIEKQSQTETICLQEAIGQSSSQKSTSISLKNYRHTQDTSAQCFVRGCVNRERLPLPKDLKQMLISEFKLYVTPNARVCQQHLTIRDWDFLNNDKTYTGQFSSTEIEAMIMLLY